MQVIPPAMMRWTISRYEARYQLPIRRPVRVQTVRAGERLDIVTDKGRYAARHLVSGTGAPGRIRIFC